MRALLAWMLLCASALGQISTTAETAYVLAGVDGWQILGESIQVPAGSKPQLRPVGLVEIDCEAAQKVIRASNAARDPVDIEQVDESTWLLLGSGKIWVDVICVDFDKNIFELDQFVVVVGNGPTPTPPDPIDPTIPEDEFDNIGRRVASWCEGLGDNPEWAAIYRKYADALRSSPRLTINEASQELVNELASRPSYVDYQSVREKINTDLVQRWSAAPMSRGVLADYWDAIARGFE